MTATSFLQPPLTTSGHTIRRVIAVLVVLAAVAVAFVIGRATVHATHATRTVTVFAPAHSTAAGCLTLRRGPC
jgi:hypothetical protein